MTYTVRAKRWEHGWELHIEGEGVTQVTTLNKAPAQVRDYLATVHDGDFSDAEVSVIPELDGLEEQVREVRAKIERVQRESVEAAEESRKVVHELRDFGLSVSDTATVLGVSRGRVSQLTH